MEIGKGNSHLYDNKWQTEQPIQTKEDYPLHTNILRGHLDQTENLGLTSNMHKEYRGTKNKAIINSKET